MITNIDHVILLWIQNELRFDWITPFWKVVTLFGEGGIFWILISVILLLRKNTRKIGGVMLVALLINAIIVNVCVKNIVCRVRPYDRFPDLIRLIKAQHDWSFPSGHTSASFACSFGLLFSLKKEQKRYSAPCIVLACFVGFSRLYLGVHYPSDVLCGALIGIFSAYVANHIVNKILLKKKEFETCV